MDVKETAKQIREVLLLLLEGGFVMPIILTSIDRYGSLMVAEYTPVVGKKDHWQCEMLAERMKSELFEPPINMLFVDARRAWCSTKRESGRYCTDERMHCIYHKRPECPAVARRAPASGPDQRDQSGDRHRRRPGGLAEFFKPSRSSGVDGAVRRVANDAGML